MKPEDWAPELLRLSIFPAPGMTFGTADTIYRELVGAESENSSRKGFTTEASGFLEDWQIVVTSTPVRLDILGRAKLAVDDTPIETIPTLGPFPAALKAFNERTSKWVKASDNLAASRVALGLVLLISEKSKAEGYARLATLLRQNIDASSSDFLYQINRRRKSRHFSDVEINRLSKWSVSKFVLVAITAGTSKQANESSSTRLELDINTTPETTRVFGGEDIGSLIEEFSALAAEIAERGDVE